MKLYDIDTLRKVLAEGKTRDELLDELYADIDREIEANQASAAIAEALNDLVTAWNEYIELKFGDTGEQYAFMLTDADKMGKLINEAYDAIKYLDGILNKTSNLKSKSEDAYKAVKPAIDSAKKTVVTSGNELLDFLRDLGL